MNSRLFLVYFSSVIFLCFSFVLLLKSSGFAFFKSSEGHPPSPQLFILKEAKKEGAVCLDGSPPGFYWRKAFGNGVTKWVIFFNGGAWCYDEVSCYQRSFTNLGSTKYRGQRIRNGGLYSNNKTVNPDFYNWNFIWIIYCDGSSWTGTRSDAVHFKHNTLYFRGKLILTFIIKYLLKEGLNEASEVVLSGSSAGSLAVLINADYIHTLLSPQTKLAAIADAGYFLDVQSVYNDHTMRKNYQQLIKTHLSSLHEVCVQKTSEEEHWKCMFPQYFFQYIKTRVFIVQSAYDTWQLVYSLKVPCNLPKYIIMDELFTDDRNAGETNDGIQTSSGLPECTRSDIENIFQFHNLTVEALAPVYNKHGSGLYLSPCFEHGQAYSDNFWNKIVLKITLQYRIHKWYFKLPGSNYKSSLYDNFNECK